VAGIVPDQEAPPVLVISTDWELPLFTEYTISALTTEELSLISQEIVTWSPGAGTQGSLLTDDLDISGGPIPKTISDTYRGSSLYVVESLYNP
jgi:hypothetical protein